MKSQSLRVRKCHSRGEFSVEINQQFDMCVKLARDTVEINSFKAVFKTSVRSDREFSKAVATLLPSTDESLDPVMAVQRFLEQAHQQAEILDSLDTDGWSGRGRQANIHSIDPDSEPLQDDDPDNQSESTAEDLSHMNQEHRNVIKGCRAQQRQEQDSSLHIHTELHKGVPGDVKKVLRNDDTTKRQFVQFLDTVPAIKASLDSASASATAPATSTLAHSNKVGPHQAPHTGQAHYGAKPFPPPLMPGMCPMHACSHAVVPHQQPMCHPQMQDQSFSPIMPPHSNSVNFHNMQLQPSPHTSMIQANSTEQTSNATNKASKVMNGADGKPPRRSQMGDGHIQVVMRNNKKGSPHAPQQPAGYHQLATDSQNDHTCQVNQHVWMEQQTEEDLVDINAINNMTSEVMTHKASSKHNHSGNSQHALIDWGADGITAEEDFVFIDESSTGRTVNATGMDNHQMTGIRVGTAGCLAHSNRGPIISMMNEAAHTGKHTTALSSLQLESCGDLVDERPTQLKGRQKIITPEGCVLPLSIVNGLPCSKTRRHSQLEFNTLPHTVISSDEQWKPRQHDNEVDPAKPDFCMNNPENHHPLPCDDCDVYGEHVGQIHEQAPTEEQMPDPMIAHTLKPSQEQHTHEQSIVRCIHSACKAATSDLWAHVSVRRRTKRNPATDDNAVDDAPTACDSGMRTHMTTKRDCEAPKPCFGFAPAKTLERTFQNSMQHGCIFKSKEGNQFRRHKSPQPAMNIHRWDEDVLMDEVFSAVPATNGGFKSAMVFFGGRSHVIHAEHM